MNNAVPLAISGWQTLVVTVVMVVVALVYGEWRARDAVQRSCVRKDRLGTRPSAFSTRTPKPDIQEEEETVVIQDR